MLQTVRDNVQYVPYSQVSLFDSHSNFSLFLNLEPSEKVYHANNSFTSEVLVISEEEFHKGCYSYRAVMPELHETASLSSEL